MAGQVLELTNVIVEDQMALEIANFWVTNDMLRAKQKADKGFLDAVYIDGEECGCLPKEKIRRPEAPYRVFGFDLLCEDFDIPFNRMTDAVKKFIELNRGPDVVFITGVSEAVQERLRHFKR